MLLACGLTALSGCNRTCGTFTTKTGMAMDGLSLDHDDYFEACGAMIGASGDIDLMGDGRAWVLFSPSHRNKDFDWNAILIDMEVYFPNDRLVEGAHLTDVTGGAEVVDWVGNHFAQAGLTSASIDVTGVRPADEECSPFRAQEFQLEWDIEWGTADAEFHYTASGKDWVSLFLDMSSSDEGCL